MSGKAKTTIQKPGTPLRMENNLEFIEKYFEGTLQAEERQLFETRITRDMAFAEEVAFYLSAQKAVKEQLITEKKQRFRDLYKGFEYSTARNRQRVVKKIWSYAAAAAVLAGLILGWNIFLRPDPIQKQAESYILENYHTLGVTMGSQQDNLQKGLQLYNNGALEQALLEFEKIATLDTSDFSAKKYAGISSLRLQQYNNALHYFKLLADHPNLYANPGTFLQAITLLKRNLPGDKQTARELLEQVVKKDLEGKVIAEQWLKKW